MPPAPRRFGSLALLLLLLALSACTGGQGDRVDTVGLPGSSASAVPVCGVVDPTAHPSISKPQPRVIDPGGAVNGLAVSGGRLYVLDGTAHVVRLFDLSGAAQGTIDLQGANGMAVDPDGAVYAVTPDFSVVKFTPDGKQAWRLGWGGPLPGRVTRVAGVTTAAGWRLAVSDRTSTTVAHLVTPDGNVERATSAYVPGDKVSITPAGGATVLRRPGELVRYDRNGHVLADLRYPSESTTVTGAPYGLGAGTALALPHGGYLLLTAYQGITMVSADGLVTGVVPDDVLGHLTQDAPAAVAGSTVYVAVGGPYAAHQTVAAFPLKMLAGLATPPTQPVLGLGAGLRTPAQDQWFRRGSTPEVDAVFDPSWSQRRGRWTVRYAVRTAAQVRAGTVVPARTVAVSDAVKPGGVKLQLPSTAPGYYEVDARLVRDGTVLSGTCLHYAVAAPGQNLDFSTLPDGADAGGSNPARAVAVAAALGTDATRVQLDWGRLRPNGKWDWSAYDGPLAAASAEAQALGVTMIVQVGQGGPERQAVDDGSWGQLVGELVGHYRDDVRVWEAWNEPNSTFGGAADYVNRVLAPFDRAVHQAEPAATVVGGSVVGMDLHYWQQLIDAGALSHLDVVGVHPYSGHNRSYEEQGTPALLSRLKAMVAKVRTGVPMWVTELAWWSDGTFDFWAQADYSARAELWHRALGIAHWAYFLPEASWGNDGVSFSAIQVGDVVKPAALALMTSHSELAGRPFTGWVRTGVPHVYAARFGAAGGRPGTLLAVWSDDEQTAVVVTQGAGQGKASLRMVDELGPSHPVTVPSGGARLPVSGSVTYLEGNGAARLRVSAVETYGPDVAENAVAGATSQQSTNPASNAVDGLVSGRDNAQDFTDTPSWASAPGDKAPALTVHLPGAVTLDRVVVTTHSVASVVPGLRDYRVQARNGAGSWETVGVVRNAFFDRTVQVSFPAREVTDLRLVVTAVNYSGYNGGAPPPWWPLDAASRAKAGSATAGPVIVEELAAYGPGRTASDLPTLR